MHFSPLRKCFVFSFKFLFNLYEAGFVILTKQTESCIMTFLNFKGLC